jgi:hypothetical protein
MNKLQRAAVAAALAAAGRLSHGKISNIWAGDDWTAILDDTGTYKAPWIP